jgi:hypothetical protein
LAGLRFGIIFSEYRLRASGDVPQSPDREDVTQMDHQPTTNPPERASLDVWENEGGAPSRAALRYRCGQRGAWKRSWSIYEVKTRMPTAIGSVSLRGLDPTKLHQRFEMR